MYVIYQKPNPLGFRLYSQLLLSLLLLLLHLFMEKIHSHSQLLFPQIGQDPTHNPTTWTSSVCATLSSLSQRRNPSLIRKELKGISSMPTCHSHVYCQHQQQRRPHVSMSRTFDREAFLQASNLWNYLSPSHQIPHHTWSKCFARSVSKIILATFQPDQMLLTHQELPKNLLEKKLLRCYGTYSPYFTGLPIAPRNHWLMVLVSVVDYMKTPIP